MINFIKRILALLLLVLVMPFILLFFLLIKLTSPGPFIFKQKRAGKNKKPFILYKIRTMVGNAEDLRFKIYHLNEADGPVFKIHNDPRYTKIGKFLSHTGLDEILQLINVIKGEMDFVGPRPLPTYEANKLPKKYERRFSVLPGMTSPWLINGAHMIPFNQWMELDINYVKNKTLLGDFKIFIKTVIIVISLILNKLARGK